MRQYALRSGLVSFSFHRPGVVDGVLMDLGTSAMQVLGVSQCVTISSNGLLC